MWGGNDDGEAVEAIRAAFNVGVTSIDTAPVYGQGHSELIVGKAIKGIERDKVQILTKYGLRWDTTKGKFYFSSKDNSGNEINLYKYAGPEGIVKECEESLKRLGTDYIDLYQIHWPDDSTPVHDTMEAVQKLIESGKVRFAGVCNYDANQLREADKYINLVSDQVPYNMVRRKIEQEVVPYCVETKKSILAYSPLERGLLTGKMRPGQKFDEGDHRAGVPLFTPENIKRVNNLLETIKPLADEKNATLNQLVLRWTLERPGINVVLVGARNAVQAISNAQAANVKLTKEEVGFISKQVDKLEIVREPPKS
jgi:aryl-alcohol dehydrogenase-like predicted oxidoreductase